MAAKNRTSPIESSPITSKNEFMKRVYRDLCRFGLLCFLVSYGLLPVAAANPDNDGWQAILDTHVNTAGQVDYQSLKQVPDALNNAVKRFGQAPVKAPSQPEQKALHINAYNAITVQLMRDNWPLDSIRDLDQGKVWDTRKFQVAGQSLTLNEIENDVLRKMNDPRIHAAISCASKSCAPLSKNAYRAESLDTALDTATLAWIQTTAFSAIGTPSALLEVRLNQIFDWYADDFLLNFGGQYRDIPGVESKTEAAINFIIDAMHKHNDRPALMHALLRGGYKVSWASYDWSHNGR